MERIKREFMVVSETIKQKYKLDCDLKIKYAEPGVMYILKGPKNQFKAVFNNAKWSIIKQ
tara:strand:- start:85 stop:264 length:180 start_codon:yes stop_codon:yes gene_type:complete